VFSNGTKVHSAISCHRRQFVRGTKTGAPAPPVHRPAHEQVSAKSSSARSSLNQPEKFKPGDSRREIRAGNIRVDKRYSHEAGEIPSPAQHCCAHASGHQRSLRPSWQGPFFGLRPVIASYSLSATSTALTRRRAASEIHLLRQSAKAAVATAFARSSASVRTRRLPNVYSRSRDVIAGARLFQLCRESDELRAEVRRHSWIREHQYDGRCWRKPKGPPGVCFLQCGSLLLCRFSVVAPGKVQGGRMMM
jgi:hypothetical protein